MAADVEEGAAVASIAQLVHIASCDRFAQQSKKLQERTALVSPSGLAHSSLSHPSILPILGSRILYCARYGRAELKKGSNLQNLDYDTEEHVT